MSSLFYDAKIGQTFLLRNAPDLEHEVIKISSTHVRYKSTKEERKIAWNAKIISRPYEDDIDYVVYHGKARLKKERQFLRELGFESKEELLEAIFSGKVEVLIARYDA